MTIKRYEPSHGTLQDMVEDPAGRFVRFGDLPKWQPIETAPKAYQPPLSHYNHHAPEILGLYGQAWYCVCSWGGPSQPYWVDSNNKKIPFQPTRWQPLPRASEEAAP